MSYSQTGRQMLTNSNTAKAAGWSVQVLSKSNDDFAELKFLIFVCISSFTSVCMQHGVYVGVWGQPAGVSSPPPPLVGSGDQTQWSGSVANNFPCWAIMTALLRNSYGVAKGTAQLRGTWWRTVSDTILDSKGAGNQNWHIQTNGTPSGDHKHKLSGMWSTIFNKDH